MLHHDPRLSPGVPRRQTPDIPLQSSRSESDLFGERKDRWPTLAGTKASSASSLSMVRPNPNPNPNPNPSSNP